MRKDERMSILLLGLTPEELEPATLDEIRTLAPGMRVVVTRDRSEIEALLDDIEIAAGWFPNNLVGRAPRLRWFQQWGAGADWLLRHPEAIDRDFVLTNTSGIHAIPISEQIIGMLLMFARGLHRAVRAQARQQWWRAQPTDLFELAGKTMLLVGVGAIGARTAMLANALGMFVEGIRRDPSRAVDGVAAMYEPDQLRERLAHADVVVLTVPLSQATRALIGAAELRAMKPTAYLVNIGRGGTVDEAALVRALEEQWIAGAALDVFAEEPLPASSPLWAIENAIITGHYAGSTPKYNERAMAIFLDNLRRYRSGEPLRNVVDKQAGY
jgi:D-2-hydroxyacid dehydrogenase (NADP+)